MKSMLCIPGTWADRNELMLAIAEHTGGKYLMAANVLINNAEKHHFEIEVMDHDPMMHNAFSYAGKVTGYAEEALEKIAGHKHVVYISGETGNLAQAKHLADAAAVILHVGGLGVKVETAGKAFEKGQWLRQLEDFKPHQLYPLFVIDSIIDDEGTVYSCGMHNLGLPDTIVSGEEFQDAVDLIQSFHYYQVVEKATILANETFGISEDTPTYKIIQEEEQPNKGDEFFENPYGMWRLERV